MAELIKQNGNVNATVEYLGKRQGQVARRAGDGRQPDQGAVLAHRPDEAACRHRRAGDVSGRRAAEGRRTGRSIPSSRRPRPATRRGSSVRHRARHDHRHGRHRRRDLPRLRRRAGRREGQHHGQVRRRPPGARVLQEACRRAAAGRAGLGRRLEQQVAGLRPGRADHEPAERLGGRQARRAAGRRAVLDARLPGRPEGRFAPFLPYFWGIWNFRKNKSAAKSLLVALSQHDAIEQDGGGERRLRPAALREAHDVQDLGRGGAAQGHALPLPEPAQPPDLSIAARRRRRRSPCRSTPRRSRPRWWCATSRARRWRRRSPGRRARSKASCAPDPQGRPAVSRRRGVRSREPRTDPPARGAPDRSARLPMSDIAIRGHSLGSAARPRSRTARVLPAEIDDRVPVHAAADPADRGARHLPGVLLGLSRHAEQAHGPVRRVRRTSRSCSPARRSGWW